jgi:DNA helicase HerA-like ATPase
MSPESVGYVVGEVRTDAFAFVTTPELAPPRLEYVCLRGLREVSGEGVREVDVLAQVASLSINSRLLGQSMNFAEVESILRRLGASPPVVIGEAKVLGYLDPQTRSVRLPRGAALPGTEVERAPDAMLREFFGKGVADGLDIGTLINRPAVDVKMDPNGLRRHMAVIAQTGAGKSYTVGVLLEQLLQLGGTVLVFDPNSDYVLMGRTPAKTPTPFAERLQVYRIPNEQKNRIEDAEIGRVEHLSVRFSGLDVDELCDLAGISEKASNIRYAVRTAVDRLGGSDYSPDDLVAELEQISSFTDMPPEGRPGGGFEAFLDPGAPLARPGSAGPGAADADFPDSLDPSDWFPENAEGPQGGGGSADGTSGPDGDLPGSSSPASGDRARQRAESRRQARSESANRRATRPPTDDAIAGAAKAIKYIEFLAAMGIWGFDDVPVEALLRPMRLSAVDLAGVDRKIADFVVTKIVSEIWKRATRDGLDRPIFIVLEEAHNFVPAGKDEGRAGWWLKRVASEGRKFGIFLVLVTQRPYRVHQDTLSQCGSQIIMRLTNPEDQNAVRRASESISESLLADLPGLNVGEAVILGPTVRVPVMVRVRSRQSDEGGSDIDLVKALAGAREDVKLDRFTDRVEAQRAERGRQPWQEEI